MIHVICVLCSISSVLCDDSIITMIKIETDRHDNPLTMTYMIRNRIF